MDILLVRHAVATDREEWNEKGEPDRSRPLTKKGVSRFNSASMGLRLVAPFVDKIYCSNYSRSQQTAEILKKLYKGAVLKTTSKLKYDVPPQETWAFIKKLNEKM